MGTILLHDQQASKREVKTILQLSEGHLYLIEDTFNIKTMLRMPRFIKKT